MFKELTLKYLIISLLLFCSNSFADDSCPYQNDGSSTLLQNLNFEFATSFRPLMYLNNGEFEKAKQVLINDVTANVFVINLFISEPKCNFPEHELIIAKNYLKMEANMQENFPIPEWKDKEFMLILEKGKSLEDEVMSN